MNGFDPASATAAYIAQLPANAQAKAAAYTAGSNWIEIWGSLIAVASAWLILRSGLLVRVRNGVGRSGLHPNRAAFSCGAVFLVLGWLIKLPWTVYTEWARERSYGQSIQPLNVWLGQSVAQGIISAALGGLLILCLYALIRRAPRLWWIYAAGLGGIAAFMILVVSPIVLGPLFNNYTPPPAGPIRVAVVELAAKANVSADRITMYDGSKQSTRFTAHVDGLGPIVRVALSDQMLKKGADLGAIRAVTAHELGHYEHLDQVRLSLGLSLMFLLATWAINRLFAPVARRFTGPSIGGLADPAGLPIIAALFAICGLALTPAINTMQRQIELSADRFGLNLARDPDGAARALLASADYRASTPSPIEEWVFYDHPSIAHRIRLAMEWKAIKPAS